MDKAFSTVTNMVRIHLVSMFDVYEMPRKVKKDQGNAQNSKLVFISDVVNRGYFIV